MKVTQYMKAIVGAIIAGLGSLQLAYIDNAISSQEIVTIAIVVVTALGGIWAVPNTPPDPGPGPKLPES